MGKTAFINAVILVAIIFLSVPLIRICSEAPELAGVFACDSWSVNRYHDPFISGLSICSLSYRVLNNKTFVEDTVSYLSKYEKSPPAAFI